MPKYIITILIATMLANTAFAQADYRETVRQYVVEKLRFFYVDNVATASATSIGPMEIDKVAISEGRDITHPIWNNLGLKDLLKRLLCDSTHGGDLLLQGRVANVLLITDKKVLVFLYNDFPNNAPSANWNNQHPYCRTTGYGTGRNNASWPCAMCYNNDQPGTTGEIGMGAYFFSAGRTDGGWTSQEDKMHVFIHELVHTQLKLKLESSLGGVSMYGNGGHNAYELIPSRNSAFNEGIATAFAMRYHKVAGWNISNWYTTNTPLNVDILAGCGASATPPMHCLATRLNNLSVPRVDHTDPAVQLFKIRGVPPEMISHNENVYAYMLHEYMDQFRSEMLLVRNVKAAKTEMGTAPFTFLPLFKEMVRSTKLYTNPTAPAATPARGHVLTMSIVDYYTGYQMDNLGELSKIIGTDYRNLPNQQYYFDYFSPTGRQELLRYKTQSGTNVWNVQQQLDRFATYLHVR